MTTTATTTSLAYNEKAAYWEKWAETMARQSHRFNEPLLEAAGVGPGMQLLDLASGAGEPALSAAALVGPKGHVTATDASAEMLAGATRRAKQAGLENITFEIADMHELPFVDDAFDALTCRFGLMFVDDPVAALSEARRVLRPGSQLAYMVWGQRRENTLHDVMKTVVPKLLGESEDESGVDGAQFRFADEDSVAPLMVAAGLDQVEERELRLSPRLNAGKPFWRPNLEMAFGAKLETLSQEERQDIETAVVDAFAPYLKEGAYHLQLHARLACATAPG